MRVCSASGVRSARTISLTRCITQSGTVSRTVTPVMLCTSGVRLSMCCTFMVESTSMLRVQQLHDVVIAFSVLAALHVGVRQFVDQSDLRLARQDRVHVHLLEGRAPVLELPPGTASTRAASSAMALRPCVSTTPTMTSSPRLLRRMPSLSML